MIKKITFPKFTFVFVTLILSVIELNGQTLVAHYKFDNSLNDETTTYNLSASSSFTPSYEIGQDGTFNGAVSGFLAADYLESTIDFEIDGNESRTMAAWVKTTTISNLSQAIVGLGAPSTGARWTFGILDDKSRVEIQGSGFNVNNSLASETWYHLAVVFDNSDNTATLFINGVNIDDRTWTNVNTTSTKLRVGNDYNGTSPSRGFKGAIDDLRIYTGAVSDTFILNLYNSTITTQTDIIAIDPEQVNQSVFFGGDNKLTVKAWADGNTDEVSRKLYQDMNLEVLRVPIFALQPITDPIYDDVITVINSVKSYNPNVKIFASIANGDGYGVNHHGASKFPSEWICCPANVYSLNLTTYSAYLDSFMQKMTDAGITIDYLGPWNEDPGDDSDYLNIINQMTKLGTTEMVGLERWALLSSVSQVDDVEDRVEIIGSHFFDDGSIPESNWDSTWSALVTNSEDPVWYTEATRYSTADNIDLLIAGLDNIFAPIRGGVEGVIFYQVCRRFVYANGNVLPIKYSGFQNIVNNSEGKLIASNSNNSNIKLVAFGNGSTLDVHIINKNTTNSTVNLNLLSNYMSDGIVTTKTWTATETGTSSTNNITNTPNWNVTLPATSYSHLKINLNMPILNLNEVALENQEIKIFPNPVSSNEYFKLKLPNNNNTSKVNVEMFSIDGKKVFSKTLNYESTLSINNNLDTGMYLISVSIDNTIYNSKVIIKK